MTKFRIKYSSDNLTIFKDKEELGSGDLKDYKQALSFIAEDIKENDIDDYEVWLHEKGNSEQLEDFDPDVIIKFGESTNDNKGSRNNRDSNDDDRNNRFNSEREVVSRQRYAPKYKPNDYKDIGLSWQAALNNSMGKE